MSSPDAFTKAGALSAHEDGVRRLTASYHAIPRTATVRLAKPTSNLFRARAKRDAPGLDTSGLTGVIAVDPAAQTADVAGHTVIEKDANSSMVTNWTVAPAGTGSTVTMKTSWQGAEGIGGFFEKTFAPLGLRKIQGEVLANLKQELETPS